MRELSNNKSVYMTRRMPPYLDHNQQDEIERIKPKLG